MKKAIEIIDVFITKVGDEDARCYDQFARTNANSIYDMEYRNLLMKQHDGNIRKLAMLNDIKRALEVAENEDNE